MCSHRYAISVDRPAATVTLTISDQDSDATIDRRHVATPAPLLGVARIILADCLRAADPHSHAVPTYSVSQVHTLKRLLDRRLREDSRAVLTSSDIGAALLKAFVAPPPGPWMQRYSVPRSHGDGTWTVAKDAKGAWGCSCPRWRFKREQCKHIQAVIDSPHHYPYLPDEK